MSNANDPFDLDNPHLSTTDPSDSIYVITPSNSLLLPTAVRALRANSAGAIKVTMRDGSTPTLNFLAGETRTGRFLQVWSTGTTVTEIEGHV